MIAPVSRRVLLFLGVLLITATAAPAATPAPSGCTSRPNVLIVALDGFRVDATSLHPSSRNETPALRALARRGVHFSRAYAPSDIPPNTHFSILTGFKTGLWSPYDRASISIPGQLRGHGYRGFVVTPDPNLTARLPAIGAFGEVVNLYDIFNALGPEELAAAEARADARIDAYGGARTQFHRAMMWASAEHVVARSMPLLDGKAPFIGLITFYAGDPWFPDPAHYDRGTEPVAVPDLRGRVLSDELQHPEAIQDDARRRFVRQTIERAAGRPWSTTLDLTPAQLAVYRERYHAHVRDLDRALGTLAAALDARKLLDSTIVIVTSAGGQAFGELDLIGRSFRDNGDFETLRHVPLIMLLPPCYGVSPATVSEQVSLADVAPTLYELLALDPKDLWLGNRLARGRSRAAVLPGLRGPRIAVRRAWAPPIPPPPLVNDRVIALPDAEAVAAKRRALIDYVWGSAGFPRDAMPARVDRDVTTPIAPTPDLLRVDALRVRMAPGETSVLHHFVPSKPNGELVVVHQGHDCDGLGDPETGLSDVIAALLARGYGVLGAEMPHQNAGDCRTHEPMFATLYDRDATAFRFFLEPIAAGLNYLQKNGGYRRFHMTGLSGGGWVTVVYAAIDERIQISIPVAASVPLYMRAGMSTGDVEQYDAAFYRIAGYPELYVLGSFGPGRRRVQILNRYDPCCFGELQHVGPEPDFVCAVREYEASVRESLTALGASPEAFRVELDEIVSEHAISPHALRDMILPALEGD